MGNGVALGCLEEIDRTAPFWAEANAAARCLGLPRLKGLSGAHGIDISEEIAHTLYERPADDRCAQPTRQGSVGLGSHTSGSLVL